MNDRRASAPPRPWPTAVRVLISLAIVAGVAVVDWLALRDVIAGEVGVTDEYFVMAVSGVVYGGVIGYWARRRRQTAQSRNDSTRG